MKSGPHARGDRAHHQPPGGAIVKIPDDVVCGVRVRCWDSPRDRDRYTVLYMSEQAHYSCGRLMRPGMHSGADPRGMSGHLEAHAGPHLGERIAFNDLPEAVRQMIRNDLNKEDS